MERASNESGRSELAIRLGKLLKDNLLMLARYNSWANERLFDAASKLSDQDLREDRGAFFGSMFGTLNHILVADRIWMARLEQKGEEPNDLSQVLHDELDELWAARKSEDRRIYNYVQSLDVFSLLGTINYTTTRKPTLIEQQLYPLLVHFFNHQTHHRGQAHCVLTGFSNEAPSLDLFVYQRETGESILSGAGYASGIEQKPQRH